jgi:hypothetical protein
LTSRAFALSVTSLLLSLAVPAAALAQLPAPPTGGTVYEVPVPKRPAVPPAPAPLPGAPPAELTVPGDRAVLLPDGTAAAPELAPPQVKAAIWAANELQEKPYKYGGGHADFDDTGYDCSGTVSFALHAARLLRRARDSSGFMRYGARGPGRWITIYTNPGHAYVVIAGLRLDTSAAGVSRRTAARAATERGPRWRPTKRSSRGYRVRHPVRF